MAIVLTCANFTWDKRFRQRLFSSFILLSFPLSLRCECVFERFHMMKLNWQNDERAREWEQGKKNKTEKNDEKKFQSLNPPSNMCRCNERIFSLFSACFIFEKFNITLISISFRSCFFFNHECYKWTDTAKEYQIYTKCAIYVCNWASKYSEPLISWISSSMLDISYRYKSIYTCSIGCVVLRLCILDERKWINWDMTLSAGNISIHMNNIMLNLQSNKCMNKTQIKTKRIIRSINFSDTIKVQSMALQWAKK